MMKRQAQETISAAIISLDAGDVVQCDAVVPLSPPAAFEMFRHDIHDWWPREMTWSGGALERLSLEGRKGGMLWELGPDGLRLDCARVMRWLPPEKLVLRWHIGPGRLPQPDAAKASEVEVRFAAEDGRHTRVGLEHRGFANLGAGGSEYRAFMGAAKGWPHILGSFAAHCEMAENVRRFRAEAG
jgi:hypothetical protein